MKVVWNISWSFIDRIFQVWARGKLAWTENQNILIAHISSEWKQTVFLKRFMIYLRVCINIWVVMFFLSTTNWNLEKPRTSIVLFEFKLLSDIEKK